MLNIHVPRKSGLLPAVVASVTLLAFSYAPQVLAKQPDWRVDWAEDVAKGIVDELVSVCPASDPGDQKAFEDCQKASFASDFIKENMKDFIFWGGIRPNTLIEDLVLTQFNEDVWRGMYLPLFMFTGEMTTEVDQEHDRLNLRAEVRFRNILKPGQYPYPFWHAREKWDAYQEANELVFTIDLVDAEVVAIQRSPYGEANPQWQVAMMEPPRKFNKNEWMWRDDQGVLQPKVTLFDGLYQPANPYLAGLESTYKTFALEMRNNTCFVCHAPNNPEKMKNLVLLQTPAHAAGEIDRVIRAVNGNSMPGKSWAGPKGIQNPDLKAKFLITAKDFKKNVDLAAAWEIGNAIKQ